MHWFGHYIKNALVWALPEECIGLGITLRMHWFGRYLKTALIWALP
jgi:hypothetical protein